MFCKSGILIFIFAENNYLVRQSICPHHVNQNTFAPSELWSLCLSFSLSGYFFGAQRPSEFTFLPSLLRPSREGAMCLHRIERGLRPPWTEQALCQGLYLAFCINQGISASFSPLLSYRRLRTTRFRSVKGPQQLVKPIVLPSLSSSSVFSFLFFASTNIPCLYISPKSTSALLIEEERTIGSFIPCFILGTVFLWALFCALNI